ncbi:hypothetical protein CPB85DRAFT_1255909 [Mucidula mucida]|nr:hypothetical protein CPB85DRAFT_1255909 [Mucidula mucida]
MTGRSTSGRCKGRTPDTRMNQETPYAGGKPGTTKRGGTKEGGGRETKIYGRDGRLEAQDDERAREKMIERVPRLGHHRHVESMGSHMLSSHSVTKSFDKMIKKAAKWPARG